MEGDEKYTKNFGGGISCEQLRSWLEGSNL